MNVMPAINFKYPSTELPPARSRFRKGVRREKVIDLPLRKVKVKSKTLSIREQEKLILEFRSKARKLGRSILRKWRARLLLEEVDSVVDLSLCEAAKRYNPTKGASFMTFLYYHLKGNLIRAVTAAASTHHIPIPDYELLEAVAGGSDGDALAQKYPNAIEIAHALLSNEFPLPDEALLKKELTNLSLKACNQLDALEKEVVFRAFLDEQQLTDIARNLGYSRCHISRVKRKALNVLSREMGDALGRESVPLTEKHAHDEDEVRLERRQLLVSREREVIRRKLRKSQARQEKIRVSQGGR